MTDHADTVRDALSWIHAHPGLSMDYQRDAEAALDALVAERDEARERGNTWRDHYENVNARLKAVEAEVRNYAKLEIAFAAAEARVADRDKIRDAASWLLANRGHRGEGQAWKLLADAVGDSE